MLRWECQDRAARWQCHKCPGDLSCLALTQATKKEWSLQSQQKRILFVIKIGWPRKLNALQRAIMVNVWPSGRSVNKRNIDGFNIERCWSGFLRRYFPIIVFANLRWNWNLGQLYFVFALPLNLFFCSTAHINAAHSAVREHFNGSEAWYSALHKRSNSPRKKSLFCAASLVALIWISTFTFHGLLNFCAAHAFLKLRVVLQISTLKASILLAFLV